MGKKFDAVSGQAYKERAVSPIKDKKDLEKVKQYLMGRKSKRDYTLFVVGINTGLRCSDLVKLKVGDVYDTENGAFYERVRVVEKKTGKVNNFVLNKSCRDALLLYFKERAELRSEDWVFLSRKNCALKVRSVNRIIREACKDVGVKVRCGSHTMRKTFGYFSYQKNIVEDPGFLNVLQQLFNHSSSQVTLRYIGIDDERKADVYKNLNL